MAIYTNPAEVQKIKAAARAAAAVLDAVCQAIKPGMSTLEIDNLAAAEMERVGCQSACLGYKGSQRGSPAFPSYICLSLNDEVVHGIGRAERIVKNGDIVSVDVVVEKDGYIGDNARTIAVGDIPAEVAKLLKVTEAALYEGIAAAKVGARVGDISHAVQRTVEAAGCSVVRDFVGHGVGRTMHEEPQIPNYGKPNTGETLKAGMVVAIEPMINLGGHKIKIDPDGWTVRTADGSPSAHYEHTVMITNKGPQVLTRNS